MSNRQGIVFALLFAFCVSAVAQPQPTSPVRFVTTNPTGACPASSPLRYNTANGAMWGCDALLWKQIGGPAVNGASGVFVNGLALTGATFPSVRGYALAINDADVYTAPAGKRALIMTAGGFNPSAGAITWFPEIKTVGGTYFQVSNTSAAIGAGAITALTVVDIVLDPGESISIHSSAAGLNITIGVIQFDSTSPFRTVKLTGTATGNQTLYTVPAGKSAWISGAPGNTWNGASLVSLFNDAIGAGNTTLCFVASGGSAACAASSVNQISSQTSTGGVRNPIANQNVNLTMSAGDFLVVNLGTGNAGQLLWLNVLEF